LCKSFPARRVDADSTKQYGKETQRRWKTFTQALRLQLPTDIVSLIVLWRLHYKLSVRDLTEMFLERGVVFTHEAVRE